MTIQAVLFDLDGTLLDTERNAMAAGAEAFATLGIDLPPGFLLQLVGRDRVGGEKIIRAQLGDVDMARLDRAWIAASRRRLAEHVPIKPGARALLDHLRGLGLPLGLVTSSVRASADLKLTKSDLTAHFDIIITASDVQHAKPAPEPYLLAARHLDVAITGCVVFEDSETGAEAAHVAGMRVVQVPDIVPTQGRFAHHVAPSLLEGAQAIGLWPPG